MEPDVIGLDFCRVVDVECDVGEDGVEHDLPDCATLECFPEGGEHVFWILSRRFLFL